MEYDIVIIIAILIPVKFQYLKNNKYLSRKLTQIIVRLITCQNIKSRPIFKLYYK